MSQSVAEETQPPLLWGAEREDTQDSLKELVAGLEAYLDRESLEQAQKAFQCYPNPASVASVAATLYYCINHLDDGVDELERFTCCYDDHYLATGQELFRISGKLRKEAQAAIKHLI